MAYYLGLAIEGHTGTSTKTFFLNPKNILGKNILECRVKNVFSRGGEYFHWSEHDPPLGAAKFSGKIKH